MEQLIELHNELAKGIQTIIHYKSKNKTEILSSDISPLSHNTIDCVVRYGLENNEDDFIMCYDSNIDEGEVHITINVIVINKSIQRLGIFSAMVDLIESLKDTYNITSIYYDNIVNKVVCDVLLKKGYVPRLIVEREDLYAMVKVLKNRR